MKKKNTNERLTAIYTFLVYTITGLLIGVLSFSTVSNDLPLGQFVINMILVLMLVMAALVVQVILHETGHLIFGLLSGFGFVSFRIFDYMLVRKTDGWHFGKVSLPSTAGQCLMSPPADDTKLMPLVMYNLGGVTMNLIVCFLAAILFRLSNNIWLDQFCSCLFAMGIALILTNGIPLRTGGVNNDGWNIYELLNQPESRPAFCAQLKINQYLSYDYRLKDIPERYFHIGEEARNESSLCAALPVMYISRLIDEEKYEEALAKTEEALHNNDPVPALYIPMMKADRITLHILLGKEVPDNIRTFSKEEAAIIKGLSSNPAIIRYEYAAAKFIEKNEKKASETFSRFLAVTDRYPYRGEIMTERELIDQLIDLG